MRTFFVVIVYTAIVVARERSLLISCHAYASRLLVKCQTLQTNEEDQQQSMNTSHADRSEMLNRVFD